MKFFATLQKKNFPTISEIKAKALQLKEEDSFKEFKQWYDSWNTSPYEVTEKWFNEIAASHTDIRRSIGGLRLHGEVALEDSTSPISGKVCDTICDESVVRGLMYTALEYWGYPHSALWYATLPDGTKTSKRILQYVDRQFGPNSAYHKQVSTAVAKLGQEWANAKTQKQTFYTTLTTTARAFALLGHYGPDDCSCFNNSGQHYSNKYNLAIRDNTFVLLIRSIRGRVDEPIGADTTLVRMWGFYNPHSKVVNFCNYYARKDIQEGNVIEACKQVSAQIFKADPKTVNITKHIISVRNDTKVVYHNHRQDQNWSFHITKNSPSKQVLDCY